MKPGNREFVYHSSDRDQQDLQRHRHPQAEPDDLAPLVLVASVADDLPDGASRSVGRARSWPSVREGAFGIATPRGDRPALDSPGPRTIASTMRSSSSSSPGISSMIWPRDITSTRSHSPASSMGSLDLTSIAVPLFGAGAQGLVDVEAGADVDALRRLVGEDHRRLLEEGAGHRDLLLVAPGEELDRLLEGRRPDLQLFDEVGDGAPLRPPPQEAEHGEPAQRLDGRVHPDAEHAASAPRACDHRAAA